MSAVQRDDLWFHMHLWIVVNKIRLRRKCSRCIGYKVVATANDVANKPLFTIESNRVHQTVPDTSTITGGLNTFEFEPLICENATDPGKPAVAAE